MCEPGNYIPFDWKVVYPVFGIKCLAFLKKMFTLISFPVV